MRKTYIIQIGNMNRQNTYKVNADSVEEAKKSALSYHASLGRTKDTDNVYVVGSMTQRAK